MAVEELKSRVRRFYDKVMGEGDLRVVDELVAPDFVGEGGPTPMHGLDSYKEMIRIYREAFDSCTVVEDIIVEGDKVAVRGYYDGVHKGELMGIAPTGKSIKVPFIDLWEFKDGKIVRGWSQPDSLGMLQQLGVIPEMGPREREKVPA